MKSFLSQIALVVLLSMQFPTIGAVASKESVGAAQKTSIVNEVCYRTGSAALGLLIFHPVFLLAANALEENSLFHKENFFARLSFLVGAGICGAWGVERLKEAAGYKAVE